LLKLVLSILIIILLSACATKDLTPMEIQQKQTELIERCKKLKKDIDNLKGKPVRRNAAIEYFSDQCVTRTDPNFHQ